MDALEHQRDMNALADALERDCKPCSKEGCALTAEWPGSKLCDRCRWALEEELELEAQREAEDEAEKARNVFGIHLGDAPWRI